MKKNVKKLLLLITVIMTAMICFAFSASAASLVWPVPGHTRISQPWHNGNAIDISDGSITGATVVAAMGGKVTHIRSCASNHYGSMHDCNGFGTGVVIEGYDGRVYQYAHMLGNSIPSNVYVGAYVSAGDKIGAVGNTGNSKGAHLHFGISVGNYWNDSGINPSNESYVYYNSDSASDGKNDLGTNFYAAIFNTERNKALTVETNNNIAMYTYTGATNQIWYFTKNSDGSYRIKSCYNGESIDVCGGSSASWVNVVTWTSNDTGAQKWSFYGNSPYLFISPECNSGVLDVADAKYDDGTNICVNVKTGHNAQLFNVVKVDAPTIGKMTFPYITFDKGKYYVGDIISFSWAKTDSNTDFYQYWVIIQNLTTKKNYYSGATGEAGDVSANAFSFIADKEGKYEISVYAVPYNNKNERQEVHRTLITVSQKHSHSYSSSIVKASTCTATGTKKYTCSCGNSYTETIVKLGHKYSSSYTIDKKATCSAEGSKSKHCTRSGCTAKTSVTAIAKLTHTYKTTTTKATLKKNGKQVTKCTVCGNVSKTTTVYYPKTIKLSATSYTYNDKAKKPSVTVKDGKGNTLKKDTDYTVKYSSGRKNPGKYTVTVTFKGKYSGTKKLSFTIKPATVTLSKVTAGSKQLTANWKTVAAVTGYEVQASTSSKFTSKTTKKVTIKSAKTKKTTIKKLAKGKKYYVKVRAYKTVSGKKIYGTWSSVKSVKVK